MGLYKNPVVYLSGPIHQCTLEECTDWRNYVTERLFWDFKTLDPTKKDFRGQYIDRGVATEIVHLDLVMIEHSDFLFAFVPFASAGTIMEIKHAHDHGKFVVTCVTDKRLQTSPWMMYHSHRFIVGDEEGAVLDEGIDFLKAGNWYDFDYRGTPDVVAINSSPDSEKLKYSGAMGK